jgi:sugar/nucleoside kinase (ribokinase family)
MVVKPKTAPRLPGPVFGKALVALGAGDGLAAVVVAAWTAGAVTLTVAEALALAVDAADRAVV